MNRTMPLALLAALVVAAASRRASALSLQSRRAAIQVAGAATSAALARRNFPTAVAAVDDANPVVARGTAKLADGVSLPADTSKAALYITVKRGAQEARVSGLIRGAPAPSIGAIRVDLKDVTFPYTFQVRKSDLFPDAPTENLAALTVSARLDDDGVAATRGAEDLVASAFVAGPTTDAVLLLKPRGDVVKKIIASN